MHRRDILRIPLRLQMFSRIRIGFVNGARFLEELERAFILAEGTAGCGRIDVGRSGADGAFKVQYIDQLQRLLNMDKRLLPVGNFSIMPDELVMNQQLAAQITHALCLLKPIEQMALRAVIIAAAHVFIELLHHTLLWDRLRLRLGTIGLDAEQALWFLVVLRTDWFMDLAHMDPPFRCH